MGVIRKTQSIDLLLSEFSRNSAAISVTDLTKRLEPKINKSTIYRTLERLEDDGVLHSFLGKSGIKWYAQCHSCTKETHVDSHPHFQCLDCGKVDCLNINVQIPNIANREVVASQVLIQGKCEDCTN
ncbi:Fur family transcriptional regulator [Tamlana crocina]|uniref:Transcriptional regulator n=1 Tax=Tamlana crocina TaxID=393006 RepID=A0ABX1DJE7_9FLAO|nr:transcriptional repressor [Tamlana crocina]NJX16441.1 transcriptional regulator [Tamlana crocina]